MKDQRNSLNRCLLFGIERIAMLVIVFCLLSFRADKSLQSRVKVYDAPAEVELSNAYEVSVEGLKVPVYPVKVAPADKKKRWTAMDDKVHSASYFDTAGFAYFDMNAAVIVTVTHPTTIHSAKILPTALGITPIIKGNKLSFKLSKPENLTVEINGETVRSLHIFANSFEKNVPKKNDPNVIYFGPGVHDISRLDIGDNKTLYIAGGAVVRAKIDPKEKYTINKSTGLRGYHPTIIVNGKNIKICGRGIFDASACPTHARNMMSITGSDIVIEGLIFIDPSVWTMPIHRSQRVLVEDVRIIGYRANSDGIDICNSQDVTVNHCFIRTLDDLVVIKTVNHAGKAGRIVVQKCVLWNQLAHPLSVGAEITDDIEDVLFRDCDIIHDQGREWALRVFHSDGALVKNVRFEHIRIEECERLMSVWIGQDIWSKDQNRGNIRKVVFKDIKASGNSLTVDLKGFGLQNTIDGVLFDHVEINEKPLTLQHIRMNEFVRNVKISR
ncbi:MAG: glycosyl hydrolase family 28 protein [Bacteroidales bacterium]|nr:glycosyl hydrolase family 28 protein [Bacteroidales bacterium]